MSDAAEMNKEQEMREVLKWIYEATRAALMIDPKLVRAARAAREQALVDINKKVQDYK